MDRSLSSDPDADRLSNVEEYAFGLHPLRPHASPLQIQSDHKDLLIQFPMNRHAQDISWEWQQFAQLSDGAAEWTPVTNATVESIGMGDVHQVTLRIPGTALEGPEFYRYKMGWTQPTLIHDRMDDGMGWALLNNANIVTTSSGLRAQAGPEFFQHSVNGNWSHSAFYKETGIQLREGTYLITFLVGHDGSARPFATDRVTIGFFDTTTTISSAVQVKDAINALLALPGVTRTWLSSPVPQHGWTIWSMEFVVAPGSAALGKTVSFGLHAQSGNTGQNQAHFDNLMITGPDTTPSFDQTIVIDADTVLRTNIPPTAFSGMNVHHAGSIDGSYFACVDSHLVERTGMLSNAYEAVGLRGIRYPGGTVAEEWYDYDDQSGTEYLNSQGCGGVTGHLDTVERVLQFSKDLALEPYFIVPRKRFFAGYNGNASHQFEAASNDAFNAVSMTMTTEQQLNSPRVKYWDIGNEVYEPAHAAADYGQFAGRIAMAIKAADPRAKTVVNVQPFNYTAASNLVATLKSQPAWWNHIDAFTIHILNTGLERWGSDELFVMTESMKSIFQNKESLFTAISPSSWNGNRGANGLMGTYEQLLRAGTDHVVLWPTVHHNASGRLWRSNMGLTPSGLAMNRLIKAAMSNDMVATSHTDGNPVKVMAFRNGSSNLSVFVMGKNAGPLNLRLAINGFASGYVTETRFRSYDEPESDEVRIDRSTNEGPVYYHYTSINTFSDYELLVLEFSAVPPYVIADKLEDDASWTLHGNGTFATSSGALAPVTGSAFFQHTTQTPDTHSAASRPLQSTLEAGEYTITVQVGHDGGSTPFAVGNIDVGLYEASTAIAQAGDVGTAIHSLATMPGVRRMAVSFPSPNAAWATWRVVYRIAADSPAIGLPLSLGLHVQSGSSGGSQAAFDDLTLEGPRPRYEESVTVQAATELADISPKMFGANLVFMTQLLDNNFSNAFLECGMKLVRYPGGTVTEIDFDFRDSDGPGNDRPSLSDVIHFCNATDTELLLVVPTKRFATNITAGVEYVSDFVRAVNIDKTFGDIYVKYWSLGNEYYAGMAEDPPGLTADQYKVIADEFAAGMVAVDPSIIPIVQFPRGNTEDIQIISDYLAASTHAGSVRAILTHAYPGTNAIASTSRITIPTQMAEGMAGFKNDDLLVTEWNIGSSNNQKGMRLANHLLSLFDGLARGGVKRTTMWPLSWQYNGVGTALSDFYTGELRPPGQAFAWLSAAAAHGTLVYSAYDYLRYGVTAYRQPDRLTILVSARDLPASRIKFTINDYAFSSVKATRMSAAGESSHDPAPIYPASYLRAGNEVYVDVNASNDWEVIRIILSK